MQCTICKQETNEWARIVFEGGSNEVEPRFPDHFYCPACFSGMRSAFFVQRTRKMMPQADVRKEGNRIVIDEVKQ